MSSLRQSFRFLIVVLGFIGVLFLQGCEDGDLDDVAKGQECFDKARDEADAEKCRKYVSGNSSEQAKILLCSIEMMAGGLTSQAIQDAFGEFEGDGSSEETKEAQLMGALTLNSTADAKTAFDACDASGSSGLSYIAGLARIGTILVTVNSDVDNALDNCTGGSPSNDCDPEAIGETAVVLADSYCVGDNEDTEVCENINDAVDGGGSNEDIGDALLALLND